MVAWGSQGRDEAVAPNGVGSRGQRGVGGGFMVEGRRRSRQRWWGYSCRVGNPSSHSCRRNNTSSGKVVLVVVVLVVVVVVVACGHQPADISSTRSDESS